MFVLGGLMKMLTVLIVAISIGLVGCGSKSFESLQRSQDDDQFGDNGGDDIINDVIQCPRYQLVVDSVDQTQASRNYRFLFNSEMKMSAAQGETEIIFNQNSSTVNYTQCSGFLNNLSVMTSLKPLDVTEALSKQVAIHVDRVCTMMIPSRYESIKVIDVATGKNLFDEAKIKATIGGCEFDYTPEGQVLRSQIIQLSHGAADQKATGCNK
jgi:hypothetical protein